MQKCFDLTTATQVLYKSFDFDYSKYIFSDKNAPNVMKLLFLKPFVLSSFEDVLQARCLRFSFLRRLPFQKCIRFSSCSTTALLAAPPFSKQTALSYAHPRTDDLYDLFPLRDLDLSK